MPGTGQTAYVIKVTEPTVLASGEFFMLYAVLTDTVQDAVEAVRSAVGSGDPVEPVGGALSAETISRLGLLYGQTLLL
jgi:hypothetical protein